MLQKKIFPVIVVFYDLVLLINFLVPRNVSLTKIEGDAHNSDQRMLEHEWWCGEGELGSCVVR